MGPAQRLVGQAIDFGDIAVALPWILRMVS